MFRHLAMAVLLAMCVVPVAAVVVTAAGARYLTEPTVEIGEPHIVDLDALDTAGQEAVASFAVAAAPSRATVITETGAGVTSWECQAGAVAVSRVSEGATSVSPGIGPFCSSCAAGARFVLPAQRLFLLAASATTVSCSRLSGSTHAASAGGGGGISQAVADGTYLRLDSTNDPVTGTLTVDQVTPSVSAPTFSTPSATDLVVAPGSGSRGLYVSSSTSGSATDGVQLIGTAAAGTGRTSVLVSTPVTSVADRYPLRVTSSAGDVLRVSGNGLVASGAADGGAAFSTTASPTSGFGMQASNQPGLFVSGLVRIMASLSAVTPGFSNDAIDFGGVSNGWKSVFVGSSIEGTGTAKTLQVNNANGVLVSSSAGTIGLSSQGATLTQNVGHTILPQATTQAYDNSLRLGGSVYTGPGATGPACSSAAHAGRIWYVDRVGDGVAAGICVCSANAAGTYGVRRIDDLTAPCDAVP